MNVLLVHGIHDTGAVFDRMSAQLTAGGHRCFAPSLEPADAHFGLEDLAVKLDAYVRQEVPQGEPLAVVAFSMGCLVARYWAQHLAGDRRIVAFFAISGPHRGSWLSYLYWGRGAREMRPRSAFLAALDDVPPSLASAELRCYWTPWDVTVVPAISSIWQPASQLRGSAFLHQAMPWNREVCDDIAEHLDAIVAAESFA